MSKKSTFTIFYSWQTDLPEETNLKAIRKALRSAQNKLEDEFPQIKVDFDEATRDTPGSPNISQTILNKIKECDLFLGDLSLVNHGVKAKRITPNPNVIFELGYAVSHLGWERVVMLFNTEYGVVEDAPFDIRHQRVSKYTVSESDPKNKVKLNELSELIFNAVTTVIRKDPKRPDGEIGLSPEQIKRNRDISNLKCALSEIHFPTLDQMILDLPKVLDDKAVYFWVGFNGVVTNSLFHIYDLQARESIFDLHKSWEACLSHDGHFYSDITGNQHFFDEGTQFPMSKQKTKAWQEIESQRLILTLKIKKLLELIREKYLSVDIDELNKLAWQNYLIYRQDSEYDNEVIEDHSE